MMMSNGGELSLNVDEKSRAGAGNGSAPKVQSPNKPSWSDPGSPRTDWQTLAQRLSQQAVSKSRPDQWGLLTALSEKARKRPQGCHIVLHNPEHVLGRIVTEVSCIFESPAVSGRHCTITRKLTTFDGHDKDPGSDRAAGDIYGTFIKDSSSNGTFIRKEKLKKNGAELQLRHGDIVSLVAVPDHENAFAFLFREVLDESCCKRKGSPSEHEAVLAAAGDGKRIKTTGKCVASDGPVSLDDVRQLERSNEELRQQLEANVLEMEKMRGEFRAAEALHVVELKEVRASVTEMYAKQIEEIRLELVSKSKEVEECSALCSHQQTTIEDLNHRLASAAQSKVDAEEAIRSHATSIEELKKRLDEEFSQHQKERAEWEANLDASIERVRLEASEELKRQSDASARLQKQQQDTIADLQEADKENRRLADSLRIKLEAERQAVIVVEEKGRRLGVQLQEERFSTENACKKVEELQEELRKVQRELEIEKEARESAAAKVASLELAMETAIRDLTLEKQRLQGARERIVLRETQLRTFYSTAAQVEALQQKQQEQLKAMLRTLEDGDGEGDYPQSRKLRTLGQSGRGGDEAKRITHLASRQMSSTPDARVLLKEKGLCVLPANADADEKKHPLGKESCRQKVGNAEPSWMDGDTQQADEECLMVSNSPSTFKPQIEGADTTMGVEEIVGEECDSAPKVFNLKIDEETQLMQDPEIPSTTQLGADSLQAMESSKGQALFKGSTGFKPFWPGRRKSNLGMDGSGSAPRDDGIVMGRHFTLNEESERAKTEVVGLGGGRVTFEIHDDPGEHIPNKESVGTGTVAENDGLAPDGSPILNVGSRMSGAHEDTEAGKSNKEAATMCTDDLLTSEVAGSWALGTQASVHTTNEVVSNPVGGVRMSDAIHNDTQLIVKEQEGTMCTDDLLASEVAGSWAVGTPASVHADNDSLSSDERDDPGPDEGGSQVAAAVSRPRSNPRHVLLEDIMHFADPVNSQNSLSPATTNPARNEQEALNEMLDVVEPGFGSLFGLRKVTTHQSDEDDSTEDDNEGNTRSDGSQPLSRSPSVSVKS
ncbi:unnamed protein product [Calypogeia fissa]